MEDTLFETILVLVAAALLFAWMLLKVVCPLWWNPKRLEDCLRKQGIHGPCYKFLFGNTRENLSMTMEAWSKPMSLNHDIVPRVIPFINQTRKTYGKIFLIWNGRQPRVVIDSPELVREILSSKFGHFEKPPPTSIAKQLAVGLANIEGEKWVMHRRILNPAFHLSKLKGMFPAFSSSCNEMIFGWEELVRTHGSCELDLWFEMQKLTADVISRTAFGSNYEEGRQIFEYQSEQAKLLAQLTRTIIPGFRFLPTKSNIRRKKLQQYVTSMLTDLVKKRIEEIETGNFGESNLLSLMLEANASSDTQEEGSAKKRGMSMEDIIEECKLFYIAGQETTSVLLTWTMVALSMHPEWQEIARAEVLRVCGNNTPTFDDLNQLKIVTMILYEVLRLYPPLGLLIRHTYKPMIIGHLNLPAGIQILIPVLLIHRDRDIWGDDSEEFNPERFAGGISNASKNQVAFFPFGWGPRICIGQTFALIEAKLTLAMVLQKFSFGLSPSYVHAPYTVLTLQPQHGVPVILQRR